MNISIFSKTKFKGKKSNIFTDIKNSIKEHDPALHNNIEIVFYPYTKTRLYYEVAHWFYLKTFCFN